MIIYREFYFPRLEDHICNYKFSNSISAKKGRKKERGEKKEKKIYS